MTKKKPDFLRDLDTAIMDELTGGGIKGNAAGLVGTLTQIKEIKQLCGLPFCGYMAKLETVRPSGVPDEVTVVFAEDVPYRACNGIEFDVMQEFVEGSRLLLTGKVQTLKDFQSGRLLVYILADFVAVSEKAVEQDEAAVRGVIANKPTYRETPRGKRITDNNRYCYVALCRPCRQHGNCQHCKPVGFLLNEIPAAGFLCLLPLPPLLFFLSHICYGICIASLVCVLYYQCLCCHSLPLFLSAALSVFPCVPLSCSGVWFYRAGCFSH